MMPLNLANLDEEVMIRHIGGSQEVRQHLENLGFVVGGNVTVVTSLGQHHCQRQGIARCDQ